MICTATFNPSLISLADVEDLARGLLTGQAQS